MNSKNLFAILIFLVTLLFLFSFVLPFKETVVDTAASRLSDLQMAYDQATKQLSLKALRLKKQQLQEEQLVFLRNFIPAKLHSGQFVYNLSQQANKNNLVIKGLQYTVLDDSLNNPDGERKLLVEFTLEGRYEDFAMWLKNIERSNVLVDVDSIRAAKNTNNSDIISFYVKLYTYGVSID